MDGNESITELRAQEAKLNNGIRNVTTRSELDRRLSELENVEQQLKELGAHPKYEYNPPTKFTGR